MLLATVGLAAVGGACGTSHASTTGLSFTETDYKITATGPTQVPAGNVHVTVTNHGATNHELVAFRTDAGEGAMPMAPDGQKVDEDSPALLHLDPEAEDIAPGHSKTITLKLTPGHYVFVCNVTGHYTAGMHASVTVG